MARKKVQEEDHWSGFVDVLSNVVMVVTFLVIILGIAMFALSQQVAETIAAEILKSEEARQALEEKMREAERAEAEVGSKGVNRTMAERALLQRDEIDGETRLTVRSRKTVASEDLSVAAAEESAKNDTGVIVNNANTFLKLSYEPNHFKLDEGTLGMVTEFLATHLPQESTKMELRAFATSTIGSVSEARRIAYYRAMTIRNIMVEQGFDPARLNIVLRDSDKDEQSDSVMLLAKPEE